MNTRERTWKSAAARRLLSSAGNPRTVYEAIELISKRYLKNVSCPPTDLIQLAQNIGISEICSEDIPHSGELRRIPEGLKIVYSSLLNENRKRFTVAHEIAHGFFVSTGKNYPREGRELERLCDLLASSFLLPRDMFLARIDGALSLAHLFRLSRTFQTSFETTAIRLAELTEASFFEVEGAYLTWAHGRIRRGPVKALDLNLQQSIQEAGSCDAGSKRVFLMNRRFTGDWWKLEWRRMRGSARTVFLLLPADSGEAGIEEM